MGSLYSNTHNIIGNRDGFTLIELSVSVFISGILALVVSNHIVNLTILKRKEENKHAIFSKAAELHRVFYRRLGCEENFLNKNISTSLPLTQIKDTKGDVILTSSTDLCDFKEGLRYLVTDLVLSDNNTIVLSPSPNEFSAGNVNLRVTVTTIDPKEKFKCPTKPPTALYSWNFDFQIPVIIDSTNEIVKCNYPVHSDPTVNRPEYNEPDHCQKMYGGSFDSTYGGWCNRMTDSFMAFDDGTNDTNCNSLLGWIDENSYNGRFLRGMNSSEGPTQVGSATIFTHEHNYEMSEASHNHTAVMSHGGDHNVNGDVTTSPHYHQYPDWYTVTEEGQLKDKEWGATGFNTCVGGTDNAFYEAGIEWFPAADMRNSNHSGLFGTENDIEEVFLFESAEGRSTVTLGFVALDSYSQASDTRLSNIEGRYEMNEVQVGSLSPNGQSGHNSGSPADHNDHTVTFPNNYKYEFCRKTIWANYAATALPTL